MNSPWMVVLVTGLLIAAMCWFLATIASEGQARWEAYASQCQSVGGKPESPRGGYLQCWDTKTGTRIFFEGE